MRKKILLLVEFKDQRDHKVKRAKVLQFCKQQGIAIKMYKELSDDSILKDEELFYFKTRDRHKVVECSDILYFKKQERKILLQTVKGGYQFYGKMDDVIENLNPEDFIVPHKSYIINKNKLLGADQFNAILAGCDEQIPISRRHRKAVLQALKEMNRSEIPEE